MNTTKDIALAKRILRHTKKLGATGATCSVSEGIEEGIEVRDGRIENSTNASRRSVSLTVLVGQREASVKSEVLVPRHLESVAEKAVEMAKAGTENKYAGLAARDLWPCDPKDYQERWGRLELCDPNEPPTMKQMKQMALELERQALSIPGVSRSASSGCGRRTAHYVSVTSEGFEVYGSRTLFSKGTSVIAEKGTDMNTGSDMHSARFFADLREDMPLAKRAADRATMLLGASPIPTAVMPVIFDTDIAARFLAWFFAAIDGDKVHTGSTFLKDRLGEVIFPKEVTITDDPSLPRGLGSRLCDDDNVAASRLVLIDEGRLNSWVTSLESAKKLGITPSGHGAGMSNLFMSPGAVSREELISGVKRGILITGFLGHGPNLTTGDISSGAEGTLIEAGILTRPVNGITVAGDLQEMMRSMRAANDVTARGRVAAPTILFERMTIAGK